MKLASPCALEMEGERPREPHGKDVTQLPDRCKQEQNTQAIKGGHYGSEAGTDHGNNGEGLQG